MSAPHHLSIGPSITLGSYLAVAHCGAVGAIWLAPVASWIAAVASIGIGASLAWSLYSRAALRSSSAVVALETRGDDALEVFTRGGRRMTCELLGTSYVSPALTVLNVVAAGERLPRHIVLVPDNVDPVGFRRLRVLLRWRRAEAGPREPDD